MNFLTTALLLTINHKTSACGGLVPMHIQRAAAASGRHILRRDTPPLESPTNQNNITHWTVDQNTRQMQLSDDAFNARDLARFNHDENVKVYQETAIRNLTEHLEDIVVVYSNTDLTLHNHDYKILFGEGDWTVAVETITGIQNGPLTNLDGTYLPSTNKPVQYDLMTIARWNDGWMLGVLPNRPAENLPDLELNLASPLSAGPNNTDTSYLNKAYMAQSDNALNDGNFTLEGLKLSPSAEIFGLSDQPLSPQGYIDWLNNMKTAFPDLRLENQPYRQTVGQGDWTASAAFLSGTRKGELVLPEYISGKPISATGKDFDLLHYTIARWQDGTIVGLRVNWDLFDLVSALGISL
ncbi:hypothetical protein CPAR01_12303 [Colletotrichum paranaense]|uniref:SnoaL-like domain-containing protein n=1 Tax=Colletotrichum paranaense TaxID=1914294 RepID=A0ABQ9SAB4_9PEZI|nr:uncharacterized protein CPAR01_12303 [Colletotrichum paranaense]KAK1529991.1 hypothetical protein CPAR01_12303 [Colletotrichum paranaense]